MTYEEWYNKSVESNQKVSAKDNILLKEQKQSINQSIDNAESLQKQQMKQLQSTTKPQKQANSDIKYHTNKK